MTPALTNALLDFQGHRSVMERALGRGGAPENLPLAREAWQDTYKALRELGELLSVEAPPLQ
jgi:hypothetical protein